MSEERKTGEGREHYTPEEKVAILDKHLVERARESEHVAS